MNIYAYIYIYIYTDIYISIYICIDTGQLREHRAVLVQGGDAGVQRVSAAKLEREIHYTEYEGLQNDRQLK